MGISEKQRQVCLRFSFLLARNILMPIFSFEEAKLELLYLSLIKINPNTGLISIHRLIQEAYLDQMSHESRLSAFTMIFSLLRKSFPPRDGHTHLYKRWAICEQLCQHVQALHNLYFSIEANALFRQKAQYQHLIRDNAW